MWHQASLKKAGWSGLGELLCSTHFPRGEMGRAGDWVLLRQMAGNFCTHCNSPDAGWKWLRSACIRREQHPLNQPPPHKKVRILDGQTFLKQKLDMQYYLGCAQGCPDLHVQSDCEAWAASFRASSACRPRDCWKHRVWWCHVLQPRQS